MTGVQTCALPISEECPEQRHFEQRKTYTYEPVDGYPKGVLTTETIADTPSFATTGFTMRDDNSGSEIVPVDGWYRIPAGHGATITKQVTMPVFTTLYDEDVSDPTTATYTPRRKDKTITWSVARHLGITLAHDAGETNIPAMPQRGMTVGDGTITYQIRSEEHTSELQSH